MPCYDSRSEVSPLDHQTATRLACDFCNQLESAGVGVPEYAKEWWVEHKAMDRKIKLHQLSQPLASHDHETLFEIRNYFEDKYGDNLEVLKQRHDNGLCLRCDKPPVCNCK